MTSYNTTFDPPAPFLTVRVSRINLDEPNLAVDCLVDTGADVSVIPQRLADDPNLAPADSMIVEGFGGKQQHLPLFVVNMVIENTRLTGIEVVAYPSTYAILGRDTLNRLRILLDGPAHQLTLL